MRALVVFESMFGNTLHVAKAVAEGLRSWTEVDAVEVGTAPELLHPAVRLLVVGGPTQAFGMSRPSTRADAQRQSTVPVLSDDIGIREWIDGLRTMPDGVAVATFDTKIAIARRLGSAARGAHERLAARGFEPIAPPETFWVHGVRGPLEPGELDRACAWGSELGRLLLGDPAPVH
ncbi:flavodoxin [Cellulomonas fimi]|uniref:Flavodoxin n=1 Tax=Cellulomonas fimi TaxID=1708 RepID=A0A7Y0LWC5_CELFI|nr:flavodoxin [Cellulomonas fimi]NMR19086.1 flavodoxin [Cellulomonas fimi]